jgi:hypothetical protein
MSGRLEKAACLLLCALLLAACAAPWTPTIPAERSAPGQPAELTPSQQYAGQLLAYMMKVVLGRAGPADLRVQWSDRGLHAPLDFARIFRIMNEPDQNRSELIVFDTRILGLSEVLYHYDPGLNLFKERSYRQSLFPSAELIALRLLLLQKMHRGEKLRLQAMLERRELLLDDRLTATAQDLQQLGLSGIELRLLQDTLTSDPRLFPYLFCPPMVAALHEMGAIREDPYVLGVLTARKRLSLPCRFDEAALDTAAVRIAVLPSMVSHFQPLRRNGSANGVTFRPSEFYIRVSRLLQERILQEAEKRLWPKSLVPGAVVFSETPARPLVIYPENADAAIQRICPAADFSLILCGKDVIRSFDTDREVAAGGRTDRLFIDVMDIERSWIEAEIETMTAFILSRLEERAKGLAARDHLSAARLGQTRGMKGHP